MRLLQKNYIKKVALNIPCLFLRKQSHFIMRVLRIIEKTFFKGHCTKNEVFH